MMPHDLKKYISANDNYNEAYDSEQCVKGIPKLIHKKTTLTKNSREKAPRSLRFQADKDQSKSLSMHDDRALPTFS